METLHKQILQLKKFQAPTTSLPSLHSQQSTFLLESKGVEDFEMRTLKESKYSWVTSDQCHYKPKTLKLQNFNLNKIPYILSEF
jgi:hypothetical protein